MARRRSREPSSPTSAPARRATATSPPARGASSSCSRRTAGSRHAAAPSPSTAGRHPISAARRIAPPPAPEALLPAKPQGRSAVAYLRGGCDPREPPAAMGDRPAAVGDLVLLVLGSRIGAWIAL